MSVQSKEGNERFQSLSVPAAQFSTLLAQFFTYFRIRWCQIKSSEARLYVINISGY